MNEKRRENRTQYIILGILTFLQSATGYDIRKQISNSTSYFWSESYGQIYPTLEKLCKSGLIQKCDQNQPRQKVSYEITEAGRETFKKWLETPYLPLQERDELLLKVFFGSAHTKAITIQHVERALEEGVEFLATLKGIEASLPSQVSDERLRLFVQGPVRYGILGVKAHMEWCTWMLEQLRGLEEPQ